MVRDFKAMVKSALRDVFAPICITGKGTAERRSRGRRRRLGLGTGRAGLRLRSILGGRIARDRGVKDNLSELSGLGLYRLFRCNLYMYNGSTMNNGFFRFQSLYRQRFRLRHIHLYLP
jgi:hypothetical protein